MFYLLNGRLQENIMNPELQNLYKVSRSYIKQILHKNMIEKDNNTMNAFRSSLRD